MEIERIVKLAKAGLTTRQIVEVQKIYGRKSAKRRPRKQSNRGLSKILKQMLQDLPYPRSFTAKDMSNRLKTAGFNIDYDTISALLGHLVKNSKTFKREKSKQHGRMVYHYYYKGVNQ